VILFLFTKENMSKIAIVEDDHTILEMYKLKFEFAKFKVVTASDGEEGLKILEQEKPDIVLLDLMMPKMNGDELLVQMRKTDWGKNIPVIVLTNISYDEAPAILKQLNVADYVIKASSTPQMVLEKVHNILNKK